MAEETLRQRIEPMVKASVQADWREPALREVTACTFALNFPGTKAEIEAELSTCLTGSAWRILWALFGDHGVKPAGSWDGTVKLRDARTGQLVRSLAGHDAWELKSAWK